MFSLVYAVVVLGSVLVIVVTFIGFLILKQSCLIVSTNSTQAKLLDEISKQRSEMERIAEAISDKEEKRAIKRDLQQYEVERLIENIEAVIKG